MSAVAAPVGKRLVRSKSGLRVIPLNESDRSPFELVEPAWIPDEESPTCTECQDKFDFIKRRHHCRRCGRVYCGGCCRARLALPRMCFLDPVRLCGPCAAITTRENTFYHHHLKALLSGAILNVSSRGGGEESSGGEEQTCLSNCRLTPDHRHLQVCGPDVTTTLPITRLTAVHQPKNKSGSESEDGLDSSGAEEGLGGSVLDSDGEPPCSCLVMSYQQGGCPDDEATEVCLAAPLEAAPSTYAFLKALRTAALMAVEARHVIGTGP